MKRCFSSLLCFFLLSFMAVPAFASEAEPDYIAEYEARYGKMPVASDFPSDEEYQAAYDVWFAGLEPFVIRRATEYEQQKNTEEQAAQKSVEEETASKTVESEDLDHVSDTSLPISPGIVSQYPDRVRVDLAGNIYSLDGELLSPGTTPAAEPADSVLHSTDVQASPAPVEDPPIEDSAPVYYVSDLRPAADPAVTAPVGLKALVISIFGEYTPVTTTSVVNETVGEKVNQYLVETVASGAAGVDYEWIAGVALFAILLFCLMKLLGGIVK